MPQFFPGRDLNRSYFQQIVKPLIDSYFPGLKYSAGLVGTGADVLGYDNPESMKANWGPRLHIFLTEEDCRYHRDALDEMFRHKLPHEFMGFSTNFGKSGDKESPDFQMKLIKTGAVNHFIQFHTIKSFFNDHLGFDPYKRLFDRDWLIFPQQSLIEVTAGEIYHDGLELQKLREKFKYYPENVWLHIYANQWERIAQDDKSLGETGELSDELGSHVTINRLVTNLMRLSFLQEKQYYPYSKWFGTAFSRLHSANALSHPLLSAARSDKWNERERFLTRAYEIAIEHHNNLKIGRAVKTKLKEHGGKIYPIVFHDICEPIRKKITSRTLKGLRYHIGSIDQFTDHPQINQPNHMYHEFRKIVK